MPTPLTNWWHRLTHGEKVVTVVAIIGVVVAILAWRWPVPPTDQPKPPIAETQSPPAYVPRPNDVAVGGVVKPPPEVLAMPAPPQTAPTERDGLADAIVTARKIRTQTPHDEEMTRLTAVAISRKRFKIAYTAAMEIRGEIRRDVALRYLVCQAAYFGDLEVADLAAEKIRVESVKNSALKEIAQTRSSDLSAIKPRVADDPHCGTL